jgi:pimeloyl-ACP methyl ester carboxylesterase
MARLRNVLNAKWYLKGYVSYSLVPLLKKMIVFICKPMWNKIIYLVICEEMKKMEEYMWQILIGIILVVIGFILLMLLSSKNNEKQFKHSKNKEKPSIYLEEFKEIGGLKQYLYHRGTDHNNPLILFLHGGPGFSMIPLINEFQSQWEKSFTIVHWDQRNTGRTYYFNLFKNNAGTNTMEQLIEDTHEICIYLKEKHHKDGIIILGHSFGSALGLLFARKYPEDVMCYFGTGQMVGTIVNEKTLYEKTLSLAKSFGNKKDVKTLDNMKTYPTDNYNNETKQNLLRLRGMAQKYNLLDADSNLMRIVNQSDHHRSEYSTYFCSDRFNLHNNLFRYMFEKFDLQKYENNYKVPVFFIIGSDDWETPYTVAEEYFLKIEAPQKNITLISNAKHYAMVDNPEEFYKTMLRDIESIL